MHRARIAAFVLTLSLGLVGMALAGPTYKAKTRHMIDGKVASMTVDTEMFHGVKAKTGHATHTVNGEGNCVLTLSDDFKVPDAPAPHWQLVDSEGNAHLLNRLVIKDDKFNKQIVVPAYVKDVAKVQIWCAYAEVLLGEAAFAKPIE